MATPPPPSTLADDASLPVHPYYALLPSYLTRDSVALERDEFLRRVRETRDVLTQLRDGAHGVLLQKKHLRVVETLFSLKHALPKALHRELIDVLVWHLWEADAARIVDVQLEVRALQTLKLLLSKWTSKRAPSDRFELVLSWRHAQRALERVLFSSPGQPRQASPTTMMLLASGMVRCVEKARPFFASTDDSSVVADLWAEFAAKIQDTHSNQCFKALGYFALLFNVPANAGDREWETIQRLVPEWLEAWASVSRCEDWDGRWFKVFSRVAKRFPEQTAAVLRDAMPFVFAKVHVLLEIPSDLGSPFKSNAWPSAFSVMRGTKRFDQLAMRLCAYLLGNPNEETGAPALANQYVVEILTTIKPFFHPSNASSAANALGIAVYYLGAMIAKRLGAEKAEKVVLKVESCRDVLDVLLQLSYYGIYSKNQSVATKCMYLLKSLLCVDPRHCARSVLDEMVKALDPHALSQSHMAPTAISSLSVFLYHLMCGQQAESTGLLFSTYLAPLLRLTLPGIDPNDEKKTMSTLTLYFHVLSWLPLVNDVAKTGGDKVLLRSDASNELFDEMKASLFTSITPVGSDLDRKAWELGSFLEEWSLALLDRCFEFIRTRANSQSHDAASKSSSDDSHRHRGEDRAVLEVLNMMSLLYAQMSPSVYTQALRKTVNFVSNSFFTSAFGGKVISTLVFDCLQGNLAEAFAPFFQIVVDKLLRAKSDSLMTNEKVWYLHILSGLVRFNDANQSVLVKHQAEIRSILTQFLLHDEEKEVYEAAGSALEHLLHALLGVYPLDFRSLPPREWNIANDDSAGMFQFLGTAMSWRRLDIQWHEPNQDELVFARELLNEYLLGTFSELEKLQDANDVTVRQWIPLLKRVFVSVRGARNIFVDATSGHGALQAGSLPLLTRACSGNEELLNALVSLKSVVLTKTRAITSHWLAHGLNGVTENQVWKIVLKVIKQLLVWRGSHLDGHRTKVKQNTYIKTTTADIASREFRRAQRFQLDAAREVPLSSRNEMTERVLFFYSKRKVQEHYETAHHVLSQGNDASSPTRAQYEALLLDVETLMKHPYEEVRNNASGVLRESAEIFTKWVHSRISTQLDVLEGKVVNAEGHVKEEVVAGALEFLRRPSVWSHLWKVRGPLLLRALKSVLASNETILKKLDTESSKAKVGLKIQEFFLSILGSWRYVREQQSTDFIGELLQAEPAQTEHWKQQLMHLVCFFPLLQPQEAPLPLRLWELIIKQVRHDVLPVRQVAVLLFAQLVKLLKTHKASGGSGTEEVDALLFSDATLTAIVNAFVDNHRNTHQFAASADGQHANSAPSDWSFGVSEAIRYLSNTSNGYPRSPPLASIRLLNQTSDAFKSLELTHMKLVQRLTQMRPTAIVRGPAFSSLDKLTGSIDVKVSDEDRQAALATLGEWVGGVLRGALKLPDDDNDIATAAVASMLDLIKKVMPHVNLTLVDPWAQVLYFAARPSQNHPTAFRPDRLESVVTYVLTELDQAFARATVEDYANQVKWLSLVEPLLVLVLGWAGAGSERAASLRESIRNTVVRIIDQHALSHRYKMVRDRAAKTLYILDVNDVELAPDARPTKVLLEKLSGLTRVESLLSKDDESVDQEEEAEALSAKETAMQWLVSADRLGDTVDFLRVMKPLFPVAFLTQNHSKVEIALLAKNATNAISLSLRLHAPPTAGSTEFAPINDLLEMLEQFAGHQRWKTRAAVLRFLTSFTFYHWIIMSPSQQQRVQQLVMSFLADEQREVQDMAKYALRSLVHIQRPTVVDALSIQLTEQAQDARIKHPKLVRRLQKQEKDQVDSAEEIAKTKARIKTNESKMATSVLGVSAIVLAFPYSVPAFVPPLFEELGRYLYIKQSTAMVSYLEKAVKDTLLEFKRTHQDNWLEIKNSFSQAQRDVFEDVLISPSYYT